MNRSLRWWGPAAAALVFGLLWYIAHKHSAPEFTALLHDGAGDIGLDSSGVLHAPAPLHGDARIMLAAVLSSHALPMAAAPADLAPVPGILAFDPRPSPAGSMVLTDTPRFVWPAAPGADGYEVTIFDAEFHELDASGRLRETNWTPVRPLPRGALYQWQITTWRGNAQDISPSGSGYKFRVLDGPAAERVQSALSAQPPSHLFAAAICAAAGLKPEARAQLQALAPANPGSELLQQLFASVK